MEDADIEAAVFGKPWKHCSVAKCCTSVFGPLCLLQIACIGSEGSVDVQMWPIIGNVPFIQSISVVDPIDGTDVEEAFKLPAHPWFCLSNTDPPPLLHVAPSGKVCGVGADGMEDVCFAATLFELDWRGCCVAKCCTSILGPL